MAKLILIIEDEPDMVGMIKMRLGAAGYETKEALDGQEGLRLAREEEPDLIILDLMLPKLDGYKVCRMLKFDEKYRHIPVIMFTAKAQEGDIKLGKEVGVNAYITKPFESKVLLSKIKELLPD